jgi:hypothetical protein
VFASDSAGYRSFFADGNTPRGETTSFDWFTVSADIAHLARNKPDVLAALVLYLDTGATSSICPILKYFTKITPCMRNVSGVGGSSIKAIGIGEVRVRIGKGRHFILKNVLYCPEASVTLISVGKLCDDGHEASFWSSTCAIRCLSGKTVAASTRAGTGLYTLDAEKVFFTTVSDSALISSHAAIHESIQTLANVTTKARPNLKTWHHRLGHVNVETMLDMARGNTVTGMDADLSHIPTKCADCILGKQKKKPVSKRWKGPCSTRKLQKVFADLVGPQAVVAKGGYLYTLQLIDDYSHEQWTILLRKKSDATQQLKE